MYMKKVFDFQADDEFEGEDAIYMSIRDAASQLIETVCSLKEMVHNLTERV